MPATDRVREIVSAALTDPQIALDGVDVSAAGKRKLVRITLDRVPAADADDGLVTSPTPALSLDDIADLSRVLSDALDREEPFGGAAYVLEVSSPGVGKALREPRHFQRNVARLLSVTRAGETSTGRILRAGPEAVVLTVGEPPVQETIPYAEIERASIVVEFTSIDEKDD